MRHISQSTLAAREMRERIEYFSLSQISVALKFSDAAEAAYQQIHDEHNTGFLWGFETESWEEELCNTQVD